MLEDGLREDLTSLQVHSGKHRERAFFPKNKALPSSLVDENITKYAQCLFAAAASAGKAGPPAIENTPPDMKPR